MNCAGRMLPAAAISDAALLHLQPFATSRSPVSAGHDMERRYGRVPRLREPQWRAQTSRVVPATERNGNEQSHGRCALVDLPLEERTPSGPDRLKDGWIIASETARCGVRREHIEGRAWSTPYAPANLASPRRAEMRMREFLMSSGYTFTMGTLGG